MSFYWRRRKKENFVFFYFFFPFKSYSFQFLLCSCFMNFYFNTSRILQSSIKIIFLNNILIQKSQMKIMWTTIFLRIIIILIIILHINFLCLISVTWAISSYRNKIYLLWVQFSLNNWYCLYYLLTVLWLLLSHDTKIV